MVNWDKLDKFSKTMEKWHNKIYKWACIGIFFLYFDVVFLGIWGWSNYRLTVIRLDIEPTLLFMYDLIAFVGAPVLLGFQCYTILFTRFNWPFQYRGDGGRRIRLTPFGSK